MLIIRHISDKKKMTRTNLCTTVDAEIKDEAMPIILHDLRLTLSHVIESRLKEIIADQKKKKKMEAIKEGH